MKSIDYLDDYLQRFFDEVALSRQLSLAVRRQIEHQRDLSRRIGSNGLRQLSIALMYYGTNIQANELCNLQIEDLAFSHEADEGCVITVHDGKGGERRVHIGEETAGLLKRYLQAHGGRTSGPLFLDARGRHLHINDVRRLIAQYPNQSMLDDIGQYFSVTSRSQLSVLPTPLRLDTNPRYTGRGVTMAFIDSGFYPHPDLMQPRRRLLAFKNVAGGTRHDFEKPDNSSWHGMQTSVSAAGNGFLSGGLYRGIASDAELVLIQVSGPRGITYQTIVDGFEWAIKKKDRYGIRILNVSLGTGTEQSYRISPLDGVAEDAVQAGIVVLVAAGNEGHTPDLNIITPPASAPSVITVGGLNDQNSLSIEKVVPYHSNFGETVDGIVKPEIVAPGIWVAAPILPGSPLFQKAQLLWDLKEKQGQELRKAVEANVSRLGIGENILDLSDDDLSNRVKEEIGREKLIAKHYQHVDGTSFSSPIVGSVIAQMLEANPSLSPHAVKEILIQTAITLPGYPRERQGYGMVHPRAAVEAALRHRGGRGRKRLSSPEILGNRVKFRYRDDTCFRVSVAGSFNGWNPNEISLTKKGRETWEADVVVPEPGEYHYKYIVDEMRWIPDPECLKNEFDGFGGKNSVFEIHSYVDTERKLGVINREIRHNGPGRGDRALRRKALTKLDDILNLETVAQADEVRSHFLRQWERLLKAISGARPRKHPHVHLLYNMGTIVRTPRLNIGIDVVSTRHVLGVYWDVEESFIERTIKALDVLFITHRHADHLDIELAERMIRAGKTVIGPSEATDVLPRGVLAFEANERRDIFGFGPKNAALSIMAHQGKHLRGRNTPLRVFEICIDDSTVIAHCGDHDFNESPIAFLRRPDVLVSHVEGLDDKGVLLLGKEGEKNEKTSPRLVILAHLAELGHTIDLGRPGYGAAYDVGDKSDLTCGVLSWGEGYVLSR